MLYRECMFDRTRRPLLVRVVVRSAMVCMMACSLVACSPDSEPIPTVSDTPTISMFESRDLAFEAAKAAYSEYFRLSDVIAAEGGANPQRIAETATPSFLTTSLEGFDELSQAGIRTTGQTNVRSVNLQDVQENNGLAVVTIYVCVDVSDIRVVDARGTDVTAANRNDRVSLVAQMVSREAGSTALVVSENEPWSGTSFC